MSTKKTALTVAPNPRVTALKARATKLLNAWQSVEVIDTTSFEAAGDALKLGVSIRKELKSILDPEIKAAKASYDAKRGAWKEIDSILEDHESLVRHALALYAAAQREAQEKLVSKAMERGNDVKAAALAAKPFVPEVAGLSFSEHWHAEIIDLASLIAAVASGTVPLDAITPNLVWLNARARSMAAEDLSIPGVKGVKETSSIVRS